MTENIRHTLTDNGRRLELSVITALTVDGIPSEDDILELAAQLRKIPLYAVSDEEFVEVIRRLHEALTIEMGIGSRIIDNHEPWLQAKKAEIDPFYWTRYQTELRKQGWAPKVVTALDRVTDEILDLMGNPAGESGWPRRGLVMGDVQSGKTSNYTGLICKAADAGYKLVILLTGTLESLRRQTQERLDAGFVGLDSSGVVNRNRLRREIGVGLVNGARTAGVFTSTIGDFKAVTVNQLGFKLRDYKEPVLLVVKKNKRILENLTDWLTTFNASHGGQINLPLLLIDDEADNASVNTNPAKATAINASIRSLLKVFPRSSYVGFTATPFANVFINPDTTDEMVGDDLFPRDFIYALDAPSNYVGARLIFGDDSPLDCLRYIEDAELDFPKGQKSDSPIFGVPPSMIDAVGCFLVVNAIMDLRTNMPRHRSMLVNVSHFTQIQNQVRDILDEVLRKMQEDIRNYASLPEAQALKNSTLASLNAIYMREYFGSGSSWSEVQAALTAATLPMEVRSVNQKTGAASLDYTIYKSNGLRVIAVGGNSLARGLTLEGLCVSYFHRGTQMYDALLQMGRWFGYRPGYEDLFRIWITEESANWYSHVSEATDELRAEIRQMQLSRSKPIDFGLKVRAHPDSLLITARNKMRDSEEIVQTMSISGEGIESSRLLVDQTIILGNFKAAQKFADDVVRSDARRDTKCDYPLWAEVKKTAITDFLRKFVSHPLNLKLQSAELADFIEASSDPKLQQWDVAIPSGSVEERELIPGLQVSLRQRKILVEPEKRSILVNEKKMRVGSPADEKAGLSNEDIVRAEDVFRSEPDNLTKQTIPSSAYRKVRQNPLLLLHLLKPIKGNPATDFALPEGCKALVAVGLSFPSLDVASQRLKYRINLVELRNMLANEAANDDDAEEDDDGELA
ncbi:Endonuclease [Collimonas arenae]|uniref:Endonuclease n=1 Tax=Collimonas arenae TaxID=279058 RepID=A0A0A1F8H8_9BURK|nr:Z1 domain-containing protein [Collimonas arenae]AIY39177.1 Endonuclease [Collimonas arenae]